MKTEKFLKQAIIYIGIILLFIVICTNLIFSANITNDVSEIVTITKNNILKLIISIVIAIFMYYISTKLQKIKSKKLKRGLLIGTLITFFLMQIVWIVYRKASPVGDQVYAYGGASRFYDTNMEELDSPEYYGTYPQQLTLIFMWNLVFNIIRINSIVVVQILNAIANTMSLLAIYLITSYLGKTKNEERQIDQNANNKSNNPLATILFCSFLVIPMLSTFIYGDEVGLCLALFSVYFIMKYCKENKKKYLFYSAIMMGLGYMFRMNNLIVIIAILIYLLLDILKRKYDFKNNLRKGILEVFYKILFIALFMIITFLPSSLVKNILISKYSVDSDKKFPVIGYLAMGISEGNRGTGWFDEDIYGVNSQDNANESYKKIIKERLEYFKKNPKEMIDFYSSKIGSTWAENSYSAVWYNLTFNFSDEAHEKDIQKDNHVLKSEEIIKVIQKGVVLLIFISSLIFIIKNRKNLSNEIILLLLIFIGGFVFHILWETKSRYIIPYIVMLIPIASMNIKFKQFK